MSDICRKITRSHIRRREVFLLRARYPGRRRAQCKAAHQAVCEAFAVYGVVGSERRFFAVGQPYGELPEPAKEGYTFAGWYTARYGGNHIGPENIVGEAQNQTLYARWNIKWYTVTFDANGANYIKIK